MGKRIREDRVAWVPPQAAEEITGEEAFSGAGEYREVLDETFEDGTASTDFGARCVWIDDAPDDAEDGDGHFEVYAGPEDEYHPFGRVKPPKPRAGAPLGSPPPGIEE